MKKQTTRKNNRLYSLDYLRGLAAFGIVFYHFSSWSGIVGQTSPLARWGIYGVTIFYVLSGLTLYHVYHERLKNNIKKFFIKRFFRIYPLLWLVTSLTIIGVAANFSFYEIILNYTGLFSLIDVDAYIAGGVWSIGNELVFYLFFPFLIYFANHKRWGLHFTFFISFLLIVYYAFYLIKSGSTISTQWLYYINPANQIFYFIAGIYIGIYSSKFKLGTYHRDGLLAGMIILFVFYPIYGQRIELITGWYRLLFSFICIMFTFILLSYNRIKNEWVHRSLDWLGAISYTIYLMHPICWEIISVFLKKIGYFNIYAQFILAFGLSILISSVIYQYYEKFFVQLGKSSMIPRKTKQ